MALAMISTTRAVESKEAPLKLTEEPSAFIHISPAGEVLIFINRLEMGQGSDTGLAMICAEELDADWSRVRTAMGDARPQFVDPVVGVHLTGGSTAITLSYTQYRELGARMRAMLLAAASKKWNMPAQSLSTENGYVTEGGGRRLGYGELFESAMQTPVPREVSLKDPRNFRLIGTPRGLTASYAKSTGRQRYTMDVRLPGQLTALIARPPVFKGDFERYDAAAALKVSGVKAVLPVALHQGGRGLAVVASGYWAAKQGRDALLVTWKDSAPELKADSDELLAHYKDLSKKPGLLSWEPFHQADVSPLKDAPSRLTAEFVFPYLNHAQMEPLACVVDLLPDRCILHVASQLPGSDAAAAASMLGFKPEQVMVVPQMAGGGFGRRSSTTGEFVKEAVAVAKALADSGSRVPVKVVWSREDDMKSGYYRPMAVHRAEIGFDASGKVLAWNHRLVVQHILAGTGSIFQERDPKKAEVDGLAIEGLGGFYDLPMRLEVHHPQVNVPVLWWRSVGHSHTAYVMETLIDEIALATKQDPVAYRMKLWRDEKKTRQHRAALALAVQHSGYGQVPLPKDQAWGVAVHERYGTVIAYVVRAQWLGRGATGRLKLLKVTAGVDCGRCINPRSVEAQVQGSVVMALATVQAGHAITLKDGVVQQGNFHEFTPLRMPEAPAAIEVHIVPSDEAPKGMGEPAVAPLAPALANAVARLTGKRHRELPFKLV